MSSQSGFAEEGYPLEEVAEIELWRARYCRLLEEACNQRDRAELVKGAERERCIDVVLAELDRASAEQQRLGNRGMQIGMIMRLREILPEAIRRAR